MKLKVKAYMENDSETSCFKCNTEKRAIHLHLNSFLFLWVYIWCVLEKCLGKPADLFFYILMYSFIDVVKARYMLIYLWFIQSRHVSNDFKRETLSHAERVGYVCCWECLFHYTYAINCKKDTFPLQAFWAEFKGMSFHVEITCIIWSVL